MNNNNTNYSKERKEQVMNTLTEEGRKVSYKTEGGKITFQVIPLQPKFINSFVGYHFNLGETKEVVISEKDHHSRNFVLKVMKLGLKRFLFRSPKWEEPVWADLVAYNNGDEIYIDFVMDGKSHAPYTFAFLNEEGEWEVEKPDPID
jgi:hypothetical protein